ncbi:Competence protein F homolog, phosphoribosyltransferase domain; protein YhgH required for utilization of DNA as sole source of carbon and energy [uncultured Candidatus Thioglobus sp.]|nr:Competence protein F homolog, phosphoribosyltransferase domain; protein YhgH required for utilization of DNA as sole source of carbon and energy [uncultured Candidatus Thioglobus sp.]
MGIYTRLKALIPQQSCVLCAEYAQFCVCSECEAEFSDEQQNRCQSCAHPIIDGANVCGQCLAHPPIFSHTYTLYDYQQSVALLIKKFKYEHQLCIGDYFAHQMVDKYKAILLDEQYDAIIPMPLSPQRIRERGFNQVLELLSVIKKQEKITIDTSSVQRIKATQPLSNLKPEQRALEVRGAFQTKSLSYKRVLLVDDIMTTGASLNELAKTLAKAGVRSCDVLTLARAKI